MKYFVLVKLNAFSTDSDVVSRLNFRRLLQVRIQRPQPPCLGELSRPVIVAFQHIVGAFYFLGHQLRHQLFVHDRIDDFLQGHTDARFLFELWQQEISMASVSGTFSIRMFKVTGPFS